VVNADTSTKADVFIKDGIIAFVEIQTLVIMFDILVLSVQTSAPAFKRIRRSSMPLGSS
jgi:hypothetical protein